jgi:Na+/proline symporter
MSDDDMKTEHTMTEQRDRRTARFGTVLWGVLLLVFAAAMAVSALPAFDVDPTTLVLGGCIAAGVLLVAAGVVTTITRSGRRADAATERSDAFSADRER